MAPGCYSPTSTKESSSKKQSKPMISDQQQQSLINDETDSFYSLLLKSSNSDTPVIMNFNVSSSSSPERIINQIPLPSTPPPPHSMLSLHDKKQDEEEEEEAVEDESDEEEEEDESDDEEEEDEEEEEKKKEGKDHYLKVSSPRLKSVGRTANLIFDTVDTFEILEQTIIKQKRLAKLKNTDLRRKVLLKRTFDRVLEIMDAENGFNDDLSDSPPNTTTTMTTTTTTTSSSGVKYEESVSVSEPVAMDALELELHPDPSSRMDDSDNDDDDDQDSSDEESDNDDEIRTTNTTLVKLVDMETSPPASVTAQVVDMESSTARVPRQVKRRSSASDDEDEEEDDDRGDESDPLDETYFYEYSMNHLMNDQQLNYRRSKLDRHERRSHKSKSGDELNLYSDLQVVGQDGILADNGLQRSNHPRKKLRAA